MRKAILAIAVLISLVSTSFTLEHRENIEFNAAKLQFILTFNKEKAPKHIPPSAARTVDHTWIGGFKEDNKTMMLYSNFVKGVKSNCLYTNICFGDNGILNRILFDACGESKLPKEKQKQDGVAYKTRDDGDSTFLDFSLDGKLIESYLVKKIERVYYTKDVAGYEITMVKQ